MQVAYRYFKENPEHIAQVQKATLTTADSELNPPTACLAHPNGGIALPVELCRYIGSAEPS